MVETEACLTLETCVTFQHSNRIASGGVGLCCLRVRVNYQIQICFETWIDSFGQLHFLCQTVSCFGNGVRAVAVRTRVLRRCTAGTGNSDRSLVSSLLGLCQKGSLLSYLS